MDNGLDITKGYHIDTLLEHGRESLKKAEDSCLKLGEMLFWHSENYWGMKRLNGEIFGELNYLKRTLLSIYIVHNRAELEERGWLSFYNGLLEEMIRESPDGEIFLKYLELEHSMEDE